MALLEVKNLKKKQGEKDVLKDISFELERGEVLCVISMSDLEKATLLRCLNYLEFADGGVITLNGETFFDETLELKRSDKFVRKKRTQTGVVFREHNLFSHCNVLKNVMLAPMLSAKELLKKERKELRNNKNNVKTMLSQYAENKKKIYDDIANEAKEILKRMGLGNRYTEYPEKLSDGQRQRVAIARAMVMHPEVLCFDEPTGTLDMPFAGETVKVIKELKASGQTMIITTRNVSFAKEVSDRVMFLSDGEIVEQGKTEEMLVEPKNEPTKKFLTDSLEVKY